MRCALSIPSQKLRIAPGARPWFRPCEIRRIASRYAANVKALGVPVEWIYLLGSQARRDAGIDSAVDLAVVSPLFEKMNLCDRAGFLGKAAWDIGHPIDVLGFSASQVRKAAPGTLLNYIIKHGIEIAH